jgi:uncharacterized membrane protein YsdA (DUF1294 family)
MDMPAITPDAIRTLGLQLGCWLLCLNAATWALAGIDRDRWAHERQRMSETALLWLALLGGWPGLLWGLRKSRRVRYDYTFRGWLRTAVMAQALFAALALTPQGAVLSATEAVAALVMPDAVASERSARPDRVVLDSQRRTMPVTGVVTLRANP